MIHCDVSICVGCKICEVACSSFHFGAVSPAMSRIRVAKLEDIGIDLAVACLSCREKSCLICPTDGLSVGEEGEIVVEIDLCNGCQLCVDACPIGAVGFYNEKPLFCDLCDGVAACIASCPNGSLILKMDEDVSLQEYQRSEGIAGRRRARYALKLAEPVRRAWKSGRRVDR